ncbi:hypothetical protein DERF_003027 [Dermatophagoides farinae]|uniref:Uncharacterized protein n=1 Tax=Dermatophagoides farinae TaxID=6954 RepID=A0A922IE07_DERFA|nr:hypothetical protein DERF_003027 [Dermatophagoides farinae]
MHSVEFSFTALYIAAAVLVAIRWQLRYILQLVAKPDDYIGLHFTWTIMTFGELYNYNNNITWSCKNYVSKQLKKLRIMIYIHRALLRKILILFTIFFALINV